MVPSVLVRRISSIADDYDVIVDRRHKPREAGRPLLGRILFDEHQILVYVRSNNSFSEMVLTLIHEWIHGIKSELPEYLVDEALDRIAYTSPKLRWIAAEKLGQALCYKEKK